ncbi:unnamed protein product [Peniophora sp. CBMAI 1063]|nr:unnamed protein product [Peniophora sp. CBMAI 1063]
MTILFPLAVTIAAMTLALYLRYKRRFSRLPHFVANDNVVSALRNAASEKRGAWEVYNALSKRHGPMFSFNLMGTPVLVLNSATLGWKILEKRGDSYSSRPRLVTAHEVLSGSLRGLSSPYNEHWKRWRKVQHDGMNSRQALLYRDLQSLEATILVRDLALDSSQYQEKTLRFAASVVLNISYGRRVSSIKDPAVAYQLESGKAFSRATIPGKYVVDSFPILLLLPRALQWFRKEFDALFAKDLQFYRSMVQDVREKMAAGTHKESMTVRALENRGLTEDERAYFVSAPFGAGLHTTAGSIEYAILAALLHPESTRIAQRELDDIVGRDRLPTFSDMASLPYVSAWIKEVQRWRPIAPLAVPHAVTRDDDLEEYRIPRDTIVYANIYTMMQDPDLFPDPDSFRPERFLSVDDQTLDPRLREFTLPFGFGRRICPGMYVALQSIFIVVARILWAFEVQPRPGAVLPDSHAYVSDGLSKSPAAFAFVLRPRFEEALTILNAEAAEADIRVKEWE